MITGFNLCIKDKHALTDLARFGTQARKHMHPDVLIGNHARCPSFKEGDILDANATYDLIIRLISMLKNKGEKGETGEAGIGIKEVRQTEASSENGGDNVFEIELTDGTISQFVVKNGNGPDIEPDGFKHVVTQQDVYDNMESYDDDTIYFIVDKEEEEDEPATGFPLTFPITLT